MANRPEALTDVKSALGEGPLWLPEAKQLLWIDIEGMCIHLYTPSTGARRRIPVGQRIGAVVPASDGRLACAMQRGFYYLDMRTERLEPIADPEVDLPGNRFNDGKCDPSGRFWAGTMPIEGEALTGSLYRLDGDGTARRMFGDVGCSNGLGWSLDETVMYYIDTSTGRVDRFDYDAATGDIANRRTVCRIPPEQGYPDGMTVDREGMLWVAHWDGGCVTRWNPDTGECLEHVAVPASRVTSCCFGGDGLDLLYITTASVGLSEAQLRDEPLAGCVFVYAPGVGGMPAHVYRTGGKPQAE
ncbi:SMP-30/gluconolactonase/LRE family protein [Cohnella sp. JJ-181]|uniref:SMP-30/gluconolactonase/LRE family protein n=1 Tax=Cohnella rhizoplanae TaxID=2974897 RepID=UPI0022FF8367|nr:SMP-30/gluconolactonase/LRE family protein [Cohnella sp. JJ-181]CAI6018673.1 6-deoxy-6-sulfogluconolactonase [Cohnella sp. JJ-181]